MERVRVEERPGKLERFKELEFTWHEKYWNERAYWRFTAAEIDELEAATETLYAMILQAVGRVIANEELPFWGYTPEQIELIEWSWNHDGRPAEFSLYQRLDLAYDGRGGPPKLLEINGDTPTSLYEAAVVQWDWMETSGHGTDQWNSIHDKLVEQLQRLSLTRKARVHDENDPTNILHTLAVEGHAEDEGTTWYVNYLAAEQGLITRHCPIEQIGWREGELGAPDRFVDLDGLTIQLAFKLYPWEWLLADAWGDRIIEQVTSEQLTLIEPAWKMVMSNKRLLVKLWELFPYHPNLLQTSTGPTDVGRFVKKPVHGREGQNVSIHDGVNVVASNEGGYGDDDFIYQEFVDLAHADGVYAVLGSWIINGAAAGMGIRESEELITNNLGQFVPHVFTSE